MRVELISIRKVQKKNSEIPLEKLFSICIACFGILFEIKKKFDNKSLME